MTDEQRAELKRLAEAAPAPHMVKVTVEAETWNEWCAAGKFIRAATPAAVLDLLAANKAYILALNFIEHDISEGRTEEARQRAIAALTSDRHAESPSEDA